MTWLQFIRFLVSATIGIGGVFYVFILMLDPYQNVFFSPDLDRAPVSTNQRFAYPALARNPVFDSAIIGTSTVRLLEPARLAELLDARFVNLAMNSATAYEQARIHELFVRHHPRVRYLVLGVDETWCNRAANIERYSFRSFPEWMYDENQWNDLVYLFNDKALENAVRMMELLLGAREPKYRPDGYRDFTLDFGPYDEAEVKKRLYQDVPSTLESVTIVARHEQPGWTFPLLDTLKRILRDTPKTTRIVLLFPPLHASQATRGAANVSECKGRIAAIVANADNVAVLDFLHISALTREDSNYWDPLHFTDAIARMLEIDVARVLLRQAPLSPFAHDLPVPAHATPPP